MCVSLIPSLRQRSDEHKIHNYLHIHMYGRPQTGSQQTIPIVDLPTDQPTDRHNNQQPTIAVYYVQHSTVYTNILYILLQIPMTLKFSAIQLKRKTIKT